MIMNNVQIKEILFESLVYFLKYRCVHLHLYVPAYECVYAFVSSCSPTCSTVYMWKSEDNLMELVSPLPPCGGRYPSFYAYFRLVDKWVFKYQFTEDTPRLSLILHVKISLHMKFSHILILLLTTLYVADVPCLFGVTANINNWFCPASLDKPFLPSFLHPVTLSDLSEFSTFKDCQIINIIINV